MAMVAEQILGRPVGFELAVINADKPSLPATELAARMTQDFDGRPLWLTNAAMFAEKASLFPSMTFIVGVDTIARVDDLRFYRNDAAQRLAAMRAIATQQCRFLVFARRVSQTVLTLADLSLSEPLRELCSDVSGDDFLIDLSSTELRQQRPT